MTEIINEIDKELKIAGNIRKYFDSNFDNVFDSVLKNKEIVGTEPVIISTEEIEDEDGNIGERNVSVDESSLAGMIFEALANERIQNKIFSINYNDSKNTVVEGYN